MNKPKNPSEPEPTESTKLEYSNWLLKLAMAKSENSLPNIEKYALWEEILDLRKILLETLPFAIEGLTFTAAGLEGITEDHLRDLDNLKIKCEVFLSLLRENKELLRW